MTDSELLARFIVSIVEPTFVFAQCHAEWMQLMTAPYPEEQQGKRLLLAPRTHGKSTVANLCSTIHAILHDPNIRILICSETDSQAQAFVSYLRQALEHPMFMAVFGDLRGSNWSRTHGLTVAGRTKVKKEPTVMAKSVGTALPSFHFDRIVLDDVIDDDDVQTEGGREAAKRWFFQTLEPTLVRDGCMGVIGTRWHYYDLYGNLLDSGDYDCRRYQAIRGWAVRQELWDKWLELRRAESVANEEADAFLVEHYAEMHEGTEVLLPQVWTYAALMLKQAASGSIIFNKQYQNEPKLGEGSEVFNPNDFMYYAPDNRPQLEEFVYRVAFFDLAVSMKEQADYFAGVVVGVAEDGKLYVLERIRDHLSFAKQQDRIEALAGRWRCDAVGVESNQYQAVMPQELKRKTTLPVSAIPSSKDKMSRALTIQGQVEHHNVYFNRHHTDLIQELAEFPYSGHDDLFDAFVGAVRLAVEWRGKRPKKEKVVQYE